jgi:hypothetical protein
MRESDSLKDYSIDRWMDGWMDEYFCPLFLQHTYAKTFPNARSILRDIVTIQIGQIARAI